MAINWKKLLGSVAPAIATALGVGGGPAGAAIALASRAIFGRDDATADDIGAALAAGASPEQIEKLREAEREFSMKLVDSAVRLEEIEAADRANARAREIATKDRMPAVLAIILTIALFATIAMLGVRAVPAENREPFLILLGALSTAWTGAMTYYHGSSSSSRAKDVVLGRIAGK